MDNVVVKNIGGQDVGFKFGMLTLKKFSEKQDLEFYQLFEGDPKGRANIFSSYLVLFQCANTVYNKGKEPSEYEVDEWIDQMSQQDLQDIWDCAALSMRNLTEKIAGSGEKKTLPGGK